MSTDKQSPGDGQKIQDLLPWYVNGTLPAEDRAQVERASLDDPETGQDLAFLGELATALRADPPYYAEQSISAELRRRIRAENSASKRVGGPAFGWLERLSFLFEPKFAGAVALIAVQAVVIGGLLMRADRTEVSEVRSLPAASAPVGQAAALYRVNFRPTASEREIRLLLVSAGARIVGGPTQLGDYYLSVSAGDKPQTAALLESSPILDSVEKLARLPSDPADAH